MCIVSYRLEIHSIQISQILKYSNYVCAILAKLSIICMRMHAYWRTAMKKHNMVDELR